MKFLCLMAILLLASHQSSAAAFIEPGLIYQSNGTYDPQNATTYKVNTIGYGAKLGWNFHIVPLLIGAEYFGTPSSSYKASAVSVNSVSGSENWFGAFIGFRIENFRLIGSYLFSDNQEIQTNDANGNSISDLKDKGTGYKVGLYYDLFRHLSLGVEYLEVTYTSESTDGSSYSTLTPNAKRSSVMASVSFPFHFMSGGKERR